MDEISRSEDLDNRARRPDVDGALRRFSAISVKSAWSGLAVSAVLLIIASATLRGLQADNIDEAQHRAYFMILWLFIVRFLYSLWRLWSTRRSVRQFRRGVERQLQRSGMDGSSGSLQEGPPAS